MSDRKLVHSLTDSDLQKLVELLKSIQYGSLTLTIREGQLVQIERNEKVRIK